ncbi:MAG: TerB family tellurite resistance protein [Myxococcota bacterium]|nr:TerB family tellurite resistance protein [Myxococcota bacterium]MDW8364104.1 TerB family tellurite resistance protein [Myxococcales bacterium]
MSSLADLSPEQRLQLLRFVCSFAWADLEVRPSERRFVEKLVRRLGLGPDEVAAVERWLEVPPPPEELDPQLVPRAHRELFVRTARRMIQADGELSALEAENLELLEALLR